MFFTFFCWLPLLLFPDCSFCYFSIRLMNPMHQIENQELDLDDQTNQNQDYGITYGIMSRYAPLSDISQVGKIGVFDSNCFHYHSAVAKNTNEFNFIYYVCFKFTDGFQEITKYVKFKDNAKKEHTYSINVDNFRFENVWFYLQIIQWPNKGEFQIFLIQYPDVILQSTLFIQYPYYDRQLILNFGGGADVILCLNQGYYDNSLIKYSYFPGEIKYYSLQQDIMMYDYDYVAPPMDYIKQKCFICEQNKETSVYDHNFIGNEKYTFTSPNPNTDSFQLVGWIKIIKIHQVDDTFIFQILKITSNLLKPQLIDDNLSPFSLSYQISKNGNRLIFTTYSYTFPSISMDFNSNPFLMNYYFDFLQNIYSWHYLSITLQGDHFQFSVDFSDGSNYLQDITVKHFHQVKFLIQIGNLKGTTRNIVNFQINQFHFSNCNQLSFQKGCHYSCQICDGPTNSDCLTCKTDSGRLYIPALKQCICPFDEIETIECQSINDLNLSIIQSIQDTSQCQYGYFLINTECFAWQKYINIFSPSIISEHQVYCKECLLNPNTWSNMLYCQQQLISIDELNYQDNDDSQKNYYIFDGENILFCQTCQSSCLNDECFFKNYLATSSALAIYQHKQDCNIQNCAKCEFLDKKTKCIECSLDYRLINGVCIQYFDYQGCLENCAYCDPVTMECTSCFSPFYLNLDKNECKLCQIEHCQYCFQFNSNDLNQNTLIENFSKSDAEQINIGCSLCDEGYNFDFTLNECIFGQTILTNCLKSFKNLQGEEICMLSSQDFFITPQTTNCLQYISNCEQCILLSNNIRCNLCSEGYVASPNSGLCELCTLDFAITCFQADFRYRDQQNPLIQSFVMLFLQDFYINLTQIDSFYLKNFASSCQDGYRPTKTGTCSIYCAKECLECIENDLSQFICVKCPLNYLGISNLSADKGNCLVCPKLCKLCQTRSTEQIKLINPFFLTNSENIIYTYTCLQTQIDANIQINPDLQVARYCFNNDCRNTFKYQLTLGPQETYYIFLESKQEFYENQIDQQFCNQMGISEFYLTIISLFDDFFKYSSVPIMTNLKEKIFSLQFIFIELIDLHLYGGLTLSDFDSIKISFQCFAPQISSLVEDTNCNLILQNNKLPVDLTLLNSVIKASISYITRLRIENDVSRNLIIKNVLLIDLFLQHTTWLTYKSNMDEKNIQIEEITIMNCIFENVTLFSFQQYSTQIKISRLTIFNTTINTSVLISFLDSNLMEWCTIERIIIEKCTINSSIFLLNQMSKLILFSDIQLINNVFTEFTLIHTYLSIQFKNLKIQNCFFYSSNLIVSTTQSKVQDFTDLYLDTFNLVQNGFQNSTLLQIQQQNQDINSVNIQLINFTHVSLFGSDHIDSQVYLYKLQCQEITIKDFKIINSSKLFYFKIQYSDIIDLFNIYYGNNEQLSQISTISVNIDDNFATLIHVQGFSLINLNNILIENLQTSDFPFIQINSDFLYKHQNIETILINNVTCIGNILLKTQLGNILSMLAIFSELVQSININQLIFEENFFHQYVDDPSQTAAGLLFISSLQSTVNINSFYCNSNGLTNSSYSFITINALTQSIQDFQIINGNILDNNTWGAYYYHEQINQNNLMDQSILSNNFKISNKRGTCKIQSSEISIINAQFKNLLSSVVEITTQGSGIITFINITVFNTTIFLSDDVQISSITIYSLSSLLHATFTNISFENVYHRLRSAIFAITPSSKQNYISMNNVSMIDCFSLINQLIAVQFSKYSLNQNFIFLHNLIVVFSEQGWSTYMTQINIPTNSEIEYIKSDTNAFAYTQGCSLSLVNISISGMLITPIFQLIDFYTLTIINLRLKNIKVMYSFRLLYIDQTLLIKQKLIIENVLAQNISLKMLDQNQDGIYAITVDQNLIQGSILFLINQLNLDVIQQGSLFFVRSLPQTAFVSDVKIKSINLLNNVCNFCYDGMFQWQYKTNQSLIIDNFVCQSNFILQYGCLVLSTQQQDINSKIIIQNSKFVANNGSSGVGIYIKKLLFIIRNCKFLLNFGTDKGGAIFTENITNSFIIEKTDIANNSANIGGGIYMYGSTSLTRMNFVHSLLAFNKANLLSNNLVEAPNHLVLSINNIEMNFTYQNYYNKVIQVLQFKTYPIIEQGVSKKTNILHLSSGTSTTNYKYYNPTKETFIDYITEFSIVLKNSRNEKIQGSSNDICTLEQRIIEQNYSSNFSLVNKIYYNSESMNFPLGNQTIWFDPYQHDGELLQLQMNCDTQLQFQMNVKTFLCQLGEYISNEGCQACQPSQGFYSVTYNATQCSIFDKSRLQDITSNRLYLNKGYWRPNKYSNQIDLCYKNQQYCIGGWSVNDGLCFQGHLGGLCEECDTYNVRGNGSFVKTSNSQCGLCQTSMYNFLPFLTISLWYQVVIFRSFVTIFLTLQSNQSTKQTFSRLKATTKLYEIIFKLNQDFESILLKMFLNSLWIFSIIFTFNINFDFQFIVIEQASNPIASMATNLDCHLNFSSKLQLVYIRIIAMIIFIIAQLLLVLLGQIVYTKVKQSTFDVSVFTNTAIYLYVSNHAALIKNLGSLAAIRTISEIQYVQGDVSLLFFDSDHLFLLLFFVVPGLGIIGLVIPLTLFLILIHNRDKFNEINFRKHLGYLFNEYTNKNQFWEQIKIWERSIIIIIMTCFETNIYYKISLLSLTILLYQELMSYRKPYIINSLLKMDYESGFIILVAMFLAQIKYICEQDDNKISSGLLQYIILLLSIRLSYSFLIRIVQLYIKKYKLRILFGITQYFRGSSVIPYFFQRVYQKNLKKSQKLSQNFAILRKWQKNIQTNSQEKLQSESISKRQTLTRLFFSQTSQRMINSIT